MSALGDRSDIKPFYQWGNQGSKRYLVRGAWLVGDRTHTGTQVTEPVSFSVAFLEARGFTLALIVRPWGCPAAHGLYLSVLSMAARRREGIHGERGGLMLPVEARDAHASPVMLTHLQGGCAV